MTEENLIVRKPRRHIRREEKITIVEASLVPGVLVAEVARQYNVAASSVVKWRRQYQEGARMSVSSKDDVVPASEVKKLKAKIKQLEQLLGRKSVDVEILKEAIKLGREKKLISRQPLQGLDDFE